MAQQHSDPGGRLFTPGGHRDCEHQSDLKPRRNHCGKEHQHGDNFLAVVPELLGAAHNGCGRRVSDRRQPKHGNRVGNHEENQRRE